MANRTILIDNFDPNLIEGFEFDTVRPDAVPEKEINAVRLALADGKKFIGSNFIEKRIAIRGHFFAGERWKYEVARDQLLGLFDPNQIVTLAFEQSGEMRKYFGTYENVVFDYKDNGTCFVTITYLAVQPFGETIATDTFINETGIIGEITRMIDTGGNVQGLPKIVATINAIDSSAEERTLSITITYGGNSRNMQITRVWSPGDSLTIDSKRQRVYVNGTQVAYNGRWLHLLKTNTFRFNIVDADSFDVSLNGTYNKRWL